MNRLLIILLNAFGLFSINIFAQTANLISTEKLGLGGFNFSNNVSTDAMGGLSGIYQSPYGTELNFDNPAANANLSQTTFEINGLYGYNSQQIGGKNYSLSNFNFNRISLGFPISDKIKFGVGYKQLTNANEDKFFIQSSTSNALSFDLSDNYSTDKANTISGGLNKLQSAVSYNYSKNLSFGLTMDYISGTIINSTNESISQKVDNPTDIRLINSKNYNVRTNSVKETLESIGVKSLVFTLGVLQKIELKNNTFVLLGATYGSGTNTDINKSTENRTQETFFLTEAINGVKSILTDQATEYPTETLLINTDNNNTAQSSLQLKSLNRFSFSSGLEKTEKYMIGLQFQFEGTGIFGNLYNTPSLNLTYQDRFRISGGGWWLPNKNSNKNYFQKIIYRGGLYYEQTPIKLDNKSINDLGISLGSGLPIGKKSLSRINLGIEYVNRGEMLNFSSNVNTVLFKFGINFTGKWFEKRLID